MKYAQVVPFEVCNGKGIGTSLFVQGCNLHCNGCFNPEAWNFDGGKKWTKQREQKFFELISRYYIKRVSFLGGEPLAKQNAEEVLSLIKRIKKEYPEKTIWIYSGYTWEQIMSPATTDDFNPERDMWLINRKEAVKQCDILVDGAFVNELKDITLPFRGSTNQRIVDVQESLKENRVILYR